MRLVILKKNILPEWAVKAIFIKKNIFDTRKEDKSLIWGHNIDRKGTSLFDPNLLKF